MSGVEGAECEDYDDGEVGVIGFGHRTAKASPTKDTKDHEGDLVGWFDTPLSVCRIEL